MVPCGAGRQLHVLISETELTEMDSSSPPQIILSERLSFFFFFLMKTDQSKQNYLLKELLLGKQSYSTTTFSIFSQFQ